jgi:2-polyprenyl-3-methyl-5-hydroxy-6-metoxy-1,4-benzoquinol methylase
METVTTSASELSQIAKQIYGRALKLSIYRPQYAPFHEATKWIPRSARLLDIGCGTGSFLLLADRTVPLQGGVGIDQNQRSIHLAQAANTSPSIRFLVAEQIPEEFLAHSNLISMIDVLLHIPRECKTGVLEQVAEKIKPGTRVIIKDLDPFPRWKALANRITDYLSTQSKVDYVALNELVLFFSAQGFKIIEKRRLDKHIWSHYLLVVDKL